MSKTVRFKSELWQDGFVMLPNLLLFNPEVSANAIRVWCALATYAREREECWPGQERLGKQLAMSQRTLHTYLRELEEHGLVETQRRGLGKTNVYRLAVPDSQEAADLDSQEVAKEVDEVEGDEERTTRSVSSPDRVQEVWDHFRRVRDSSVKGSSLSVKPPTDERRLIREALKVATAAECCKAIDGLFGSDFHQQRGKGKQAGRRHTRLSDVLRAKRPSQYGNGYTLRERIEFFCEKRDEQLRGKQRARDRGEDWRAKSMRDQGLGE